MGFFAGLMVWILFIPAVIIFSFIVSFASLFYNQMKEEIKEREISNG